MPLRSPKFFLWLCHCILFHSHGLRHINIDAAINDPFQEHLLLQLLEVPLAHRKTVIFNKRLLYSLFCYKTSLPRFYSRNASFVLIIQLFLGQFLSNDFLILELKASFPLAQFRISLTCHHKSSNEAISGVSALPHVSQPKSYILYFVSYSVSKQIPP